MKKLIFSTFLILIFFTSLSFSQTQRHDYKKVDYIQVDQDKSHQFIKMARELMKPAYQKMVDSGDIKSWKLYLVNYGGGKSSEYNFVCVVTVPEIRTIEEKFSKVESLYFMPASSGQKDLGELASLSYLVASEIWKVRSLMAQDTTETMPSQYLTMDYMSVDEGAGPEYLMLEDEVAMPLHQERAKKGQMAGWEVYSLVLPGGTEYGYNYATGNFFDHIAHVEFGFTREIINQALPGTDVQELLDTIYDKRDLVKSEMWELVTHAK